MSTEWCLREVPRLRAVHIQPVLNRSSPSRLQRECEALASQMAPLELNSEDEKALVGNIYWSAMECLSQVRRGGAKGRWGGAGCRDRASA